MRIALISDLHLEFRSSEPVWLEEKVDVLVLAGDISSSKEAIEEGLAIADGNARHIVQIAGNHEFYGDRLDKGYKRLRADAQDPALVGSEDVQVHFLQNDVVTIDGWNFAGATLWTDYDLVGRRQVDMQRAEGYMNDHRRIKFKESESVYRRFLPKDAAAEHRDSRFFLASVRANIDYEMEKTVFVTHHAPSFNSVNEKNYGHDELNSAYASQMDHFFVRGPKYWFHGHMHDPVDYRQYDTRVIANPRGYPNERANPQILVIDL